MEPIPSWLLELLQTSVLLSDGNSATWKNLSNLAARFWLWWGGCSTWIRVEEDHLSVTQTLLSLWQVSWCDVWGHVTSWLTRESVVFWLDRGDWIRTILDGKQTRKCTFLAKCFVPVSSSRWRLTWLDFTRIMAFQLHTCDIHFISLAVNRSLIKMKKKPFFSTYL